MILLKFDNISLAFTQHYYIWPHNINLLYQLCCIAAYSMVSMTLPLTINDKRGTDIRLNVYIALRINFHNDVIIFSLTYLF